MSDITYIATTSSWVYLAIIIDLHSRHIIGWQLADHMRAELVCQAIEKARDHRGCLPKLFHSDQGSQYVSEEFENVLSSVTISMSRKENCWDNAVAESFFGTLKTEHKNHETYKNIREARMSLFQYIEGFYNHNPDILRWEIFHHLSLKKRLHNPCPFYGVQVKPIVMLYASDVD